MIRHQLTAQKQVLIALLVAAALVMLVALKVFFNNTDFLLLTPQARIEIYLIGVVGAVLYLHHHWSDFIRKSYHPALFEAMVLAGRFALIQAVAFTTIYFLLRDIATSRAFLTCFLLAGLPINTAIIAWAPKWLQRVFSERNASAAILAGKGPVPWELVEYTGHCRSFGIDFRDHFGEPLDDEAPFRHRGNFEDLADPASVLTGMGDRVLFYGATWNDPDYARAIENCRQQGVRVQIYLHKNDVFQEPAQHIVDGDFHFLTFVKEPLQNPLNKSLKRIFDIAISLPVALLLLPPLTLLVWAVQRRQSPGPVFFRQTRYGLNRKAFRILKFRTMAHVVNSGDTESQQAKTGDSRVFSFGRFLRRTSLDEVPQFLNVLCGEMSVVGPRPHLTVHDEAFERAMKAYRTRHFVKPGITGYAQVRGFRGAITAPEQVTQRVQHDLSYINHWSLQLDFYIVCKTIVAVFVPPNTAV